MSWDFGKTTIQIARKDYLCEAAEWIAIAEFDDDELCEVDRIAIQKAKSENWQIKKGQKYIKTTGMWDGEFSVFRARIDLDDICKKYDLYE